MAQYKDIDLTFTAHPNTGDITRLLDIEAVKASMRNILLTDIGSKPFDRYFGLGLSAMLFEDLSPSKLITVERLIFEKLTEYEPRIVVESVRMDLSEVDNNSLVADIFFYMVGNNQLQSLNFVIERTR